MPPMDLDEFMPMTVEAPVTVPESRLATSLDNLNRALAGLSTDHRRLHSLCKVEYSIIVTPRVTGCDGWHSMIERGIKNQKTVLARTCAVDGGDLGPHTFHGWLSGTVASGPATVSVTAESATTPRATPTTAKAASPSSQAAVAAKADTRKAAWIEHVRNRAVSGTILGQSDDEIVASAKKMCDQMRGGELFEEVAYNLVATGLSKPYQTDMQLIFGTATVQFCPEFLIDSGTGNDTAALKRLRTVAPSIAHNGDSAILDQARTACPSVSEGPAALPRLLRRHAVSGARTRDTNTPT